MPIYQKARQDVLDIRDEIIGLYHRQLTDAKVQVDVMVAFSTPKAKTPAVRLHGRPCYAIVRIISLKNRVAGLGDAEIVIDGDRWSELSIAKKRAIIDHELTHLALKYKNDVYEIDDIGRPKLVIRPHDYDFGWFEDIVRRHGEQSVEWDQWTTFPGFNSREVDSAGNT